MDALKVLLDAYGQEIESWTPVRLKSELQTCFALAAQNQTEKDEELATSRRRAAAFEVLKAIH